jgi:hypothetical protein
MRCRRAALESESGPEELDDEELEEEELAEEDDDMLSL